MQLHLDLAPLHWNCMPILQLSLYKAFFSNMMLKPLQNKKGQKILGYPRKKQSFFSRVPQIFLALLIQKRLQAIVDLTDGFLLSHYLIFKGEHLPLFQVFVVICIHNVKDINLHLIILCYMFRIDLNKKYMIIFPSVQSIVYSLFFLLT